jgi:hypothetical protein
MTEEKKVTQEESDRNYIKSTLENKLIMGCYGAGDIMTKPNEFGSRGNNNARGFYESMMFSDEMNKQRQKVYNEAGLGNNKYGIPEMPSNKEMQQYFEQRVETVFQRFKIGDLAESVKKMVPGMDFEIHEDIKNYTLEDGMKDAQNRGAMDRNGSLDYKKLGNKERLYFESLNLVKEAYKEGAIQEINSNIGKLNQVGKEIINSYNESKPQGDGKNTNIS